MFTAERPVMRRVLVVNEDESARQALQVRLRGEGYEAVGVPSIEGIRRALGAEPGPAATIVILPAGATSAAGLAAIAAGAHDFVVAAQIRGEVQEEGRGEDLTAQVALAFEKLEARAAGRDRQRRATPVPASAMIGESAPMKALAGAIRKVAPYKATVLVQGESGTGKELIARAVHDQSPRAGGPFVAVNCGAIPAGLMESELFGHAKGAFTDALRDRVGLLEQSSGGTLFLDEVGELPAGLQVKLLRALQEEQVRRLGDDDDRRIDLRLVAATARDLEAEVADGRFREDLFHRINVVALRVPPLRDRAGDIPLLAAHFVTRINQRSRLAITGLSREAMRLLNAYRWPGNVRELENTIERAAVMCEGPEIDADSLPDRILNGRNGFGPVAASAPAPVEPFADLSIKRAARRVEEELIRQALARTGGNRTRAAELLDISHRALLYKIKEYGVSLPMTTGGPAGPPKDGKD
jgi:two-component system response regulator AtoC